MPGVLQFRVLEQGVGCAREVLAVSLLRCMMSMVQGLSLLLLLQQEPSWSRSRICGHLSQQE